MLTTLTEEHRHNPPMLVITENNILDEIDMSIEYHLKKQDIGWQKGGLKAYYPPLFKNKSDETSH